MSNATILQQASPGFDYPVRVQPHHTDYAGIVWHGSYVAWLEEARVECLRAVGVGFEDLVALGIDLPVVDLNLRYRESIRMGAAVRVRVGLAAIDGVRLRWDCRILGEGDRLHATAQVTLVPVDRERGRILRQMPPHLLEALERLQQQFGSC